MKLSDLLCYGKDFAMTAAEIQSITGFTPKQIREKVRAERLRGVAIVGDSSGYYMAETLEERRRFVASMRHRAAEIRKAADAVEAADF